MSEEAIRSYLQQLQKVVNEDKRLAEKRKELSLEKKALETKIQEYIAKMDIPGVKFGSLIVTANQKKVRPRMKKAEKIASGCRILEELGIQNSKAVLTEIIENMKGEVSLAPGITITQTKESEVKSFYE